jgi:hypothetical protein
MAPRRQNIVRVMVHLADDLERRAYPMAGVLRQLAREVATLDEAADVSEDGCRCGAPIVQPRTGRPRKFCVTCSPRKSARKRDDDGDHSGEVEAGAA